MPHHRHVGVCKRGVAGAGGLGICMQVSTDRVDRLRRVQPSQHRADEAVDRAIDAPLAAVRPEAGKVSAYRKVRLLNVDVDDITMDELVENFRQGVMLTLHVDMIMKLQKDRDSYQLLPSFDVVTCDSQILIVAARLLGTPLKGRVSGSDYFPRFYARYKDDP